jgi:hypothetical protein
MNLDQLGLLLPEDTKDLACWPFAKKYFSCQGTHPLILQAAYLFFINL